MESRNWSAYYDPFYRGPANEPVLSIREAG